MVKGVIHRRLSLVSSLSAADKQGKDGTSTEGSPKPLYRKLKPRLGSHYQTRVVKLSKCNLQNYVPIQRPSPEKMSIQDPHLTQSEYNSETLSGANTLSEPTPEAFQPGKDADSHETIRNSRRGGQLMHKKRSHQDAFIAHCQEIFPPTNNHSINQSVDVVAFQQEMIHLYGQTGRRSKKRRTMDCRQMLTLKRPLEEPMSLEDQEGFLEHLAHNDDASALSIRVQLQQGQATKARRLLERDIHNERFRRPDSRTSGWWRLRYDESFAQLAGDWRQSTTLSPKYEWQKQIKEKTSFGLDHDWKGVWRCILSFGQALEKDNKPSFEEVMDFLHFSHAIQVYPEEAYSRHHVCVENIAKCMDALMDQVSAARNSQAVITDYLFKSQKDGIDLDTLTKLVREAQNKSPLTVKDNAILKNHIDSAKQWQGRVENLKEFKDQLAEAENLHEEGKKLILRTKNMMVLEKRIEKARALRDRLDEWDDQKARGRKQTVKFVAALVRDAHRIDLPSSQVKQLLDFNKSLECWIERANIAIRSRLSLEEIETLLTKAFTMPLDLSEFVDKLKARVKFAKDWMSKLEARIPRAYPLLEWMKGMRKAIDVCSLQDLASEGARIPVEMNCVKMLQLELDAKNWSTKARKWLPGRSDSKKGKLEDLREHLARALLLRERLTIENKEAWSIDGERELAAIVNAADNWLIQFSKHFDIDHRRTATKRSRLSYTELKRIATEGESIHANFATATNKLARVMRGANEWFRQYGHLVRSTTGPPEERRRVVQQDLLDAAAAASKDVEVDLEEAIALQKLAEKIQHWAEKVALATPKRSRRVGKGRWATKVVRHRVNELTSLIDASKELPVETSQDVDRLTAQLNEVQAWRLKAHGEFRALVSGFRALSEAINVKYGPADEYTCGDNHDLVKANDAQPMDEESKDTSDTLISVSISDDDNVDSKGQGDAASREDSSTASEADLGSPVGNHNINRLLANLLSEAKQSGVLTSEEEVASDLDEVSRWCFKSLKFLERPRNIFEKRLQKAFDSFILSGQELLDSPSTKKLEDMSLSNELTSSSSAIVSAQLIRLRKLQVHRNKFMEWSKNAQAVITSKDKKLSFKIVKSLAEESHQFPATADMVQRVRNLYHRIIRWRDDVLGRMNSGEKILMNEAKALCDEGEKLKVFCDELKVLRNGIKAGRAWLNKVKKSKIAQGETSTTEVEKLIREHDKLLVSLPEEAEKLNQALKGYCICRRPYEGFMIGCDDCGEWYHGSCIGVTQSQAGRVDKFLCVRCGVKKVFLRSAATIASTIRKWTCVKDFKKARQIESQKHQRKVRKERKDVEKFNAQIIGYRKELQTFIHGLPFDQSCDEQVMRAAVGGDDLASTNSCIAPAHQSSTLTTAKAVAHAHVAAPGCGNGIHPGKEIVASTSDGDNTAEQDASSSDQPINQITPDRASEITRKIIELEECIENCQTRMQTLAQKAAERAILDAEEERCKEMLRFWCIRVRSLVLTPTTHQQSIESRPSRNGTLSHVMLSLLNDAERLGIYRLPDVVTVENALRCIAWSWAAMTSLSRKPKKDEVEELVRVSSTLDLPDEKAVRVMKFMVQKTSCWQARVHKALAPKPGETKSFNVELLKMLEVSGNELPFDIPETHFLATTLEDKGSRHCLCGGANDGTFMLGCDKCELWFHGRCVNVSKEEGEQMDNWLCPTCSGDTNFVLGEEALKFDFSELERMEDESSGSSGGDAPVPCAPLPERMWPPFGLSGSEKASEVLGEDCMKIEESAGDWDNFRANVISITPPTRGTARDNCTSTPSPQPNAHEETTEASTPLLSHETGVQNQEQLQPLVTGEQHKSDPRFGASVLLNTKNAPMPPIMVQLPPTLSSDLAGKSVPKEVPGGHEVVTQDSTRINGESPRLGMILSPSEISHAVTPENHGDSVEDEVVEVGGANGINMTCDVDNMSEIDASSQKNHPTPRVDVVGLVNG